MNRVLILFVIFLLSSCSFTPKKEIYYPAPTRLPNTFDLMKVPGFWISKLKNPDSVLLNDAQIDSVNNFLREKGLILRPYYIISDKSKKYVKSNILNGVEYLRRKKYVDISNKKYQQEFFDSIVKFIDTTRIKDKNKVLHAITIDMCAQKLIPTDNLFLEKYYDIDFDYNQNSTLDFGEPVAVLWYTIDSSWAFVISSQTRGWVKSKYIKVIDREKIRDYFTNDSLLVTIEPKIEIFKDSNLTQFYTFSRMGTKFYYYKEDNNYYKIFLPTGDIFFIRKNNVHKGFIKYTQRHVINTAFKFLNEPYGWGGMYREQDCSRFINEIYSVFGFNLPRNSQAHKNVGIGIDTLARMDDSAKKEVILSYGVAGVTLLILPGHIMLYIGEVNGEPYVIHETWGYRQNINKKQVVFVINKVVVSDLNLGMNSKKGSLIKRISSIRKLCN